MYEQKIKDLIDILLENMHQLKLEQEPGNKVIYKIRDLNHAVQHLLITQKYIESFNRRGVV